MRDGKSFNGNPATPGAAMPETNNVEPEAGWATRPAREEIILPPRVKTPAPAAARPNLSIGAMTDQIFRRFARR